MEKIKDANSCHGKKDISFIHFQKRVSIVLYSYMYISVYLGSKSFLLGEKPCEEDCAVFGLLAEFYWMSFGNKAGSMIKGT